jgi:hypothetical protein
MYLDIFVFYNTIDVKNSAVVLYHDCTSAGCVYCRNKGPVGNKLNAGPGKEYQR